jgi:predicted glycoside hydrolase/deacetylase ChbG (UPF0249 family)
MHLLSARENGIRHLIVNADDFGRSHGINRGIFTAHQHGIVTSASLMVRWPAAHDAVAFARAAPALGLGLHLDLAEWIYEASGWRPSYEVVDHCDAGAVRAEIWRQVERFDHLYGAYPTHLDSHQHVHRTEPIRSAVLEVAAELGVVVREEDRGVIYCGDFHGQTGRGESLPHAITPDALTLIVSSLAPGTTEVACHPGLDDESGSVYAEEREVEVVALCHPGVRATIETGDIALRSFRGLAPERKLPACETTT